MTISIMVGDATGLLGWGPEIWSGVFGIGGAVIGSIVGGAISWRLQSQSLMENRNARAFDANEKKIALGYAIVLKLNMLRDGFSAIKKHLEDASPAKHKTAESSPEWWETLRPMPSLPDPVHFTLDEQVLVMRMRKLEILNSMLEIDTNFLTTLDALRVYRDLREKLQDSMLSQVTSVDGSKVSARLDASTFMRVRPKMIDTNSIAEHLSEIVPAYEVIAEETLSLVLKELRANGLMPQEVSQAATPNT